MSTLRQSINSCSSILRALIQGERAVGGRAASQTMTAQTEGQGRVLAARVAHQHQPQRSIVSVDVHGNKVDRALRQLRRKLIDEGVREKWLEQRVFVKPSHVRKRVLEEAQRRVKGEGFKEKMRWILRRKARGY